MKSKKSPIPLIVTLVVLSAAGFGAYKYFNQPPKLTYLKAQVTRGPLESIISATGTLSATRSIPVGSRVSGNVVRMYADYNTVVKKGQLLAEIDPSTYQNDVEQRTAALESAKTQRLSAEVAEARADVDVANAETAIKNQIATVARTKSQETEAHRQYDLQIGLQKEGIAASNDVTKAKVAWDQAILSTESAESQLVSTKASLESVKAQRKVVMTQSITADSAIKQAQGQLTSAELQLSFTKIPSPVDGVVIARNMNEGQTVQASTTAPQLYEIAEDLTEMHLDTNIDESDISRVQTGQECRFRVDAFPGQEFHGEVIQIRRGAVNVQNVISYTVVVSVQNPELKLFPGMTANTSIIVERVQSSLRVPSSALRFRPPTELTVVGDVGGKGKGNSKDSGEVKDGATTKSAEPKQTSKAENAKETTVAENTKGGRNRSNVDANADGDNSKGGRGNIDINQFKDKDGNIDRERLREAYSKNGGKGFDPSQFKGRADGSGKGKGSGNFDPSQFARNGGGRGAGRAGGAGQVQQQTVYRLNAKNEIEAIRIRTGISDGNWIQVLGNNLQEGEELITAVEGLPASSNKQNNNNFPGGNNNNQFKGNNFKGF